MELPIKEAAKEQGRPLNMVNSVGFKRCYLLVFRQSSEKVPGRGSKSSWTILSTGLTANKRGCKRISKAFLTHLHNWSHATY